MTKALLARPNGGAVLVLWNQDGRTSDSPVTDANNGYAVAAGVRLHAIHRRFSSPTKSQSILLRSDQVAGDWTAGNFADGDALLFTDVQRAADGPIRIDFVSADDFTTPTPVNCAGAQIQTVRSGEFTAVVRAVDTDGHVVEFRRIGQSNANADNSAIFIGADSDGGAGIVRIEFLTTNIVAAGHARFDALGFAINQLSVLV